MNSKKAKIILIIHSIIMSIGFVIGFGFVPQTRSEFSDIVNNIIIETQTDPFTDSNPDQTPPISNFAPKTVAILPKNKQKWNKH